jgi:hypothetical protein
MNSTASGTTPYRLTNNRREALIYPQTLSRQGSGPSGWHPAAGFACSTSNLEPSALLNNCHDWLRAGVASCHSAHHADPAIAVQSASLGHDSKRQCVGRADQGGNGNAGIILIVGRRACNAPRYSEPCLRAWSRRARRLRADSPPHLKSTQAPAVPQAIDKRLRGGLAAYITTIFSCQISH